MRFLQAFGSPARMAYHLELEKPIVIRRSGVGDETALTRLPALDSRTLPAGSFLLGEINGEVVAAVPLDADAAPLKDPFRATANVRELLLLQAGHVRRFRDRLGNRGARPESSGTTDIRHRKEKRCLESRLAYLWRRS
jgi:hypothetical protein